MIIRQLEELYSIVKYSREFVNGTKEVVGVHFIMNSPMTKRQLESIYKKRNLNLKTLRVREVVFYDRIYYSLRHIISAQLKEYGQNRHSRKFIYTSSECISSFHVLERKSCLICLVYIRSSDVKKTLPLDARYCYRIAEKINREFFKRRNISCKFVIGSAHMYEDEI